METDKQSLSIQKSKTNKQLVLLSRNISWLSKLTPVYVLTESAPDTSCDRLTIARGVLFIIVLFIMRSSA